MVELEKRERYLEITRALEMLSFFLDKKVDAEEITWMYAVSLLAEFKCQHGVFCDIMGPIMREPYGFEWNGSVLYPNENKEIEEHINELKERETTYYYPQREREKDIAEEEKKISDNIETDDLFRLGNTLESAGKVWSSFYEQARVDELKQMIRALLLMRDFFIPEISQTLISRINDSEWLHDHDIWERMEFEDYDKKIRKCERKIKKNLKAIAGILSEREAQ